MTARQAGLKDAMEQGVEVNFENEAFLEIMAKHTEGLSRFRSRL
jgi:hypothetical protein